MSKITRRDLLQYIGAGGMGAVGGVLYGESRERNVELLVPQVVPPEDYSPGVASWYNTVCRQCSAGCGISVRIREGKAKKIEGNPVHPVSQGRSCARGQAGLNALYNPDRIKGPLTSATQRGTGSFYPMSWDDALTSIGSTIGRLKIENNASRVRLLTGRVGGHLDALFAQFMELLGSDHYQQYDFTYPSALAAANRICFGMEQLPYYDIKNADLLVSFGADYLGTWISPVQHSLAYGHMRQGRQGRRGKTVQIEPRMSLSGANADEWIAARPGTEGLLALGLAHAIVSQACMTTATGTTGQRRCRATLLRTLLPRRTSMKRRFCDLPGNLVKARQHLLSQAAPPQPEPVPSPAPSPSMYSINLLAIWVNRAASSSIQ
jgi:anaerobic selenocysteine-containing dehydrogenase